MTTGFSSMRHSLEAEALRLSKERHLLEAKTHRFESET